MGGQACVLYGGAQFSRDTDLAILADAENLARLSAALQELQAERIAVPPLEQHYLDLGLAVHFRCGHPEANKLRIDVMSRMRGVAPFVDLWDRRTTVEFPEGTIDLLSLPDLVQAKKTQRAKDWPMIALLLEANYFANRESPTAEQLRYWLAELRSPDLLISIAQAHPSAAAAAIAARPLLSAAVGRDEAELQRLLLEEQVREQEADRQYWKPLKAELERLRRDERK